MEFVPGRANGIYAGAGGQDRTGRDALVNAALQGFKDDIWTEMDVPSKEMDDAQLGRGSYRCGIL